MARLASNVDEICGYPLLCGQTQPVYGAGHNQFSNNPALQCQVKGKDELQATKVTRKRGREEQECGTSGFSNKSPLSISDENVELKVREDIQETNHYLISLMEKMRMELEEKRKKQRTNLIYTLNEALERKLKCKDEEIVRLLASNSNLVEKLKSVQMQCEYWKIIARNHATVAASLQRDIEAAQANVGHNDFESTSSCCEDNGRSNVDDRRECKKCRRNEISTLMLPCRHLCVCAECDVATKKCPMCMLVKASSIQVFMS